MSSRLEIIDSDSDDVLEINENTNHSGFNIRKPSSGLFSNNMGADMLINRNKVSDIASISSQQSREGSVDEYDTSYRSGNDSSDSSSSSSSDTESVRSDASSVKEIPQKNNYNNMNNNNNSNINNFFNPNKISNERAKIESEYTEKKEILYQMDRLESKGFRLPRKFSMQSNIEEMRTEYQRILREKEVDASIRFQRKMLMAFVTGIEFLNTRFDPFDIRLDGWSENIQEDITDYDDIFEELHDKYKSTGRKMAPELRLLMSLSGSAFMFHLTNSMFKQQPLPDVEQVLRSDPKLMKQFQQAAAGQMYGMQQQAPQRQAQSPSPMGGGIFNMLGGLLGGGGLGSSLGGMMRDMPPPPVSTGPQSKMRGPPNVDDIINDIEMNPGNRRNNIETLSFSDDEITSIIEDAADINSVRSSVKQPSRGRRAGTSVSGKRTLDI
jgi:hypothetical protein